MGMAKKAKTPHMKRNEHQVILAAVSRPVIWQAMELLQQYPYLRKKDLTDMLGLNYDQSYRHLADLVKHGFAEKRTGHQMVLTHYGREVLAHARQMPLKNG